MFHSELTKSQILEILMDKLEESYNQKENIICGDDEELSDKFCARYDLIREIVNSCRIYTYVDVK